MTIAIWISVVSLMVTLFFSLATFLFNLRNNKRTDANDIKDDVKEETRNGVLLEMINNTTKKIDIKVENINDRLVRVEESCKQAHHRINTLEERIDKGAK